MHAQITGEQARGLLNGTTPGPWATSDDAEGPHERYIYDWDSGNMCIAVADDGAGSSCTVSEIRLAAAAPALAETVAWLYGREPQQSHASGEVFHCAEEEDNDLPWAVSSMPGKVSVTPTDRRDLTPDEAVDLARALLNAAERTNDPT